MQNKTVVTLGEPAGIGPDLMVMLAQRDDCPPCLVIGDADCLAARAAMRDLPLTIQQMGLDDALPDRHEPGHLMVHHTPLQTPAVPGQLQAEHADDVVYSLQIATQACLAGQADAWVTGPIHKAQLRAAGHPFTGHTEWLSQACQTPVTMLFHTPTMHVALVTTHLPLTEVASHITTETLTRTIQHTASYLQQQGIRAPRLTVLGLNPHAGESGHMGTEEMRVIAPVINELSDAGMRITGPVSACTAFMPEMQAQSDAYIGMYHDQVLPVVKALHFDTAVNVTLGLPFIRTSPDHGTALSLAGHGAIQCDSMLAALRVAQGLCYD